MSEQKTVEMTPINPPERKRTYHFADGRILAIENVSAICVRPSGSHRLETVEGQKWIVAPGWVAIELDIDKWTLRPSLPRSGA